MASEVEKSVLSCIKKQKNFVVTGGAGSGKTELLKEILSDINVNLPEKKVICITHTNVAVDEIKERINGIYEVMTIHSFVYSLISQYKINIKGCLYDIFKLLTIEEIALKKGKDSKDYDVYKSTYEKYWKKRFNLLKEKTDLIVSKKVFDEDKDKYIRELNIKIKNLNDKIQEKIDKDCDYKKIKYNETRYNIFKNFSYGHDGLLDIFVKLINDFPLFQKIIRDKYNLILIDEYQDTDKKIIKSLVNNYVDDNHSLGLFGDPMQSIYTNGMETVQEYIAEGVFEEIKKDDNYRCSIEVINFLNSIRKDLTQKIAYSKGDTLESRTGKVKAYYIYIDFIPKDDKDKYNKIVDVSIEYVERKCLDSKVLLLSNLSLAKKMKYENLYRIFDNNFQDINEEIEEEMDKMQWNDAVYMYNCYIRKQFNFLIDKLKNNNFRICSYEDKIKINKVFSSIDPNSMSVKDVMKLLIKNDMLLVSESRKNEISYYNGLIEKSNNDKRYNQLREMYITNNTFTKMKKVIDITQEEFYDFENKYNSEVKMRKVVEESFHFSELINYYNYTIGNEKYLTMHKTKGTSIRNVIVLMEEFFWSQYNFEKLISNKEDVPSTLKLFYVACSRARKNLSCIKILKSKEELEEYKAFFKGIEVEEIKLNSETIGSEF